MKSLILLAASLLALAPGVLNASPRLDATRSLSPNRNIDLGCALGVSQGGLFPTRVFDAATRERITYNISACTGGYIRGMNVDTGAEWSAQIAYNRRMTGKDLDGRTWRYDPAAGLYTNLATGKSCAQTSLRRVCAD
jgi:hypothetical protein